LDAIRGGGFDCGDWQVAYLTASVQARGKVGGFDNAPVIRFGG
jgi:hypothetical protein